MYLVLIVDTETLCSCVDCIQKKERLLCSSFDSIVLGLRVALLMFTSALWLK